MPQHPPAGEVVISRRPVSVFANGSGSEIEQLQAEPCAAGGGRPPGR